MRRSILSRTEITLVVAIVMMRTTSRGVAPNSRYLSSWKNREGDCYKEAGRGLRLGTSHVDKFVKAGSLRDCERSCDIAFFACKSFSYSDYHTGESENCLLSREDTYTLDLHDPRDFYNDPDFTFYQTGTGRDCDYEAEHYNSYFSVLPGLKLVTTRGSEENMLYKKPRRDETLGLLT
ncbi:hypothetical protein SK128_014053, partial [Halocaridina rubra]